MTESSLPDALFAAIGRVAAAGAVLEDVLRYVLAEHSSGRLSHGSVVFEGQSLDWLASNAVAVMTSRIESPGLEFDEPETVIHVERLRELLKDVHPIKNARNTVVHGVWRSECDYEGDDDAHRLCKPRSSVKSRTDRAFHVTRSRYRAFTGSEESWTVADIVEVASATEELVGRIMEAHEAYYVARHGAPNTYARRPV